MRFIEALGRGFGEANVLVLRVYADASGKRYPANVMTVAGLVASAEAWDGPFYDRWKAALASEGVEYFRMSEFENWAGQFSKKKGWDRDDPENWERGRRLLTKLIVLMNEVREMAFGSSVDLLGWEALHKRFKLKAGVEKPYHWCGYRCIDLFSQWRQVHERTEEIVFTFEAGDEGVGDLTNTFDGMKRRGVSILDPDGIFFDCSPKKKQHPGLQAADLLAYELRWAARTSLGAVGPPPKWPPRESLARINHGSKLAHEIFGPEHLMNELGLIESGQIPKLLPYGPAEASS